MIESEILALKVLVTGLYRLQVPSRDREGVVQVLSDKIAQATLTGIPGEYHDQVRNQAAVLVAEILAP